MEQHVWILETLKELAQVAKNRRLSLAARRLINVAEVYSAEVGTNEVERMEIAHKAQVAPQLTAI